MRLSCGPRDYGRIVSTLAPLDPDMQSLEGKEILTMNLSDSNGLGKAEIAKNEAGKAAMSRMKALGAFSELTLQGAFHFEPVLPPHLSDDEPEWLFRAREVPHSFRPLPHEREALSIIPNFQFKLAKFYFRFTLISLDRTPATNKDLGDWTFEFSRHKGSRNIILNGLCWE